MFKLRSGAGKFSADLIPPDGSPLFKKTAEQRRGRESFRKVNYYLLQAPPLLSAKICDF